ncbi:MAG TPA: recombinase RecA [Nitriliruptorales bacterium]|nr:recombinase RecA [Nitriliruptorales bacterium]
MDREKALEMALGQIEKQFGKGTLMKLGADQQVKVEAIPTGALSLDLALGIGGLPRGRVVEIYGPESSGKSSLALHVIAEAQKLGGIAAFIDAEHALDPVYARAIGVDIDELLVAQPDTGEQALEIADMLVRSGAVDLIVIDSVAALVPLAEIEGEMGDSHVGLQARLMSQALRKLTGNLSRSKTCCVFINQLREKVGVLFGCMAYDTRVTLADGSQESIGKIVNQKLPVEVLSYDPERGEIVPRKVVGWYDNGRTDEFLHITVANSGPTGDGHNTFACTRNHLVMTPSGWKEAQELEVGDRVVRAVPHHLSDFQWEVILGGLIGDSALSQNQNGLAARLRWEHGAKQAAYGDWKASLFSNLNVSRTTNRKGAVFHDVQPLAELAQMREAVDWEGKKLLSWDYLKRLTPLSLAIWYMDDATFTVRSKGVQQRTRGGTGRAEICVQGLEPTSRTRLQQHLRDTWELDSKLLSRAGKAVLQFPTQETEKLQALIAPSVHPSMEYKLLPRYRGQFAVEPVLGELRYEPAPMPITKIEHRPPRAKSTHRFDIQVEGSHNYFVDGVMVHNSPETTPGGRALKFYSSVRLDVRRIESLKDGQEFVGNRVRAKVVKNKCLAAASRIFDPTTGVTRTIEEIVVRGAGSDVWAADKSGRLHIRPITGRLDQGEQEVMTLRLHDGQTLVATPDHRILTEHGWRTVGELRVGDRVARPRQAGGFGGVEPVSPDQARSLGLQIGDASEERIPPAFFAPEVSEEVIANLIDGLLESAGWIGREQSGGLRCGFVSTSEQLMWQVHWLLLRWGITSTVGATRPGDHRSDIAGRPVIGTLPGYQVRVSGIDDVRRFAGVIPMWGPRGQALVAALADPSLAGHRGSRAVYLPEGRTEEVLAHLRGLGITARLAASMIGLSRRHADGGWTMVLGQKRLRRDRLESLAEALDSAYLRGVLEEELSYERITAITGPEWAPTYDLEVEELHNFVADSVVVHNCAAPFRQAEFDILFGEGISREGSILDVGVETGVVKKAGAWYQYEGDQLGQGRENARQFLKENDDIAREIEKKAKEALGISVHRTPAPRPSPTMTASGA